jgi:5-methylcytosine-specific restriction endonuclease McrA
MSSWFSKNRHLYPGNWNEIADRVKTLAGWQCEACGVPHGPSPHVLTVDHLDHNPANNDNKNLMALCQRCHLRRQALYPSAQTRVEAIVRLKRRTEFEQCQLNFLDH